MFRLLPRESAGSVMGTIFSNYYLMGMVLGAIALAAAVGLGLRNGWGRMRLITIVMLLAMIAAAGHNRYNIAPKIIEVRGEMWQVEKGTEAAKTLRGRMDDLHHLAVGLNGAMLLVGIFLIGVESRRERKD